MKIATWNVNSVRMRTGNVVDWLKNAKPDVVVLHRGLAHWIEVKSDVGVLSEDQQAMCAALLVAGCRYAVARESGEVLTALDAWKIPRNRRVHISCAA